MEIFFIFFTFSVITNGVNLNWTKLIPLSILVPVSLHLRLSRSETFVSGAAHFRMKRALSIELKLIHLKFGYVVWKGTSRAEIHFFSVRQRDNSRLSPARYALKCRWKGGLVNTFSCTFADFSPLTRTTTVNSAIILVYVYVKMEALKKNLMFLSILFCLSYHWRIKFLKVKFLLTTS